MTTKTKVNPIEEWKTCPVAFSRKFLVNPDTLAPFEPHVGQIELLKNIKPFTVACCGRQWGKSVACAVYICWYLVTHPNRQVYIVAPTLDQARIIFNEVIFQFTNTGLKYLLKKKIKEFPFPEIALENGSEFHGRGGNSPQFIRGKKMHVCIVDEAAFVKDQVLTETIQPMFLVTGQSKDSSLVCISTPFGLGAFHNFAEEAKTRQKEDGSGQFFRFKSEDNPHADKKFLERIKKQYGETSIVWRTEYCAEFAGDDLAVFSAEDIKWAYEHYPHYKDTEKQNPDFPIGPKENRKYVQGVDLANRRDWFVSTILDTTDRELSVLVRMDRYQRRGYTFYKSVTRKNHTTYNRCKTCVDATSLGESVAEDLRDIAAEGYAISSNKAKHEIVSELARMFQEHRIAIPFNRDIISELHNFQYEITASKVVKMEAKEGHDDIVMSLSLAAHLACLPHNTGFFRGVTFTKKGPIDRKTLMKNINKYLGDPFADAFADEKELIEGKK